jgi:hypothetical protein
MLVPGWLLADPAVVPDTKVVLRWGAVVHVAEAAVIAAPALVAGPATPSTAPSKTAMAGVAHA